jgi:hypothetical protein
VSEYIDWRNRPAAAALVPRAYPLLVPLLLVFATLINWG